MKITLSKSQWEMAGKKYGLMKKSQTDSDIDNFISLKDHLGITKDKNDKYYYEKQTQILAEIDKCAARIFEILGIDEAMVLSRSGLLSYSQPKWDLMKAIIKDAKLIHETSNVER